MVNDDEDRDYVMWSRVNEGNSGNNEKKMKKIKELKLKNQFYKAQIFTMKLLLTGCSLEILNQKFLQQLKLV